MVSFQSIKKNDIIIENQDGLIEQAQKKKIVAKLYCQKALNKISHSRLYPPQRFKNMRQSKQHYKQIYQLSKKMPQEVSSEKVLIQYETEVQNRKCVIGQVKTNKIEQIPITQQGNSESEYSEPIQWFYSLPQEEKRKVFVIRNKNICHIIIKMYWYQQSSLDKQTFCLYFLEGQEQIQALNEHEINVQKLFYVRCQKSTENFQQSEQRISTAEHKIVNNVLIGSQCELYDTICFKDKFIEDDNFIRCFQRISKKQCFLQEITKNEQTKNYNLPLWFNIKAFQSLTQWIMAYMEKQLWLRYLDYKFKADGPFNGELLSQNDLKLLKTSVLDARDRLQTFWDEKLTEKTKLAYQSTKTARIYHEIVGSPDQNIPRQCSLIDSTKAHNKALKEENCKDIILNVQMEQAQRFYKMTHDEGDFENDEDHKDELVQIATNGITTYYQAQKMDKKNSELDYVKYLLLVPLNKVQSVVGLINFILLQDHLIKKFNAQNKSQIMNINNVDIYAKQQKPLPPSKSVKKKLKKKQKQQSEEQNDLQNNFNQSQSIQIIMQAANCPVSISHNLHNKNEIKSTATTKDTSVLSEDVQSQSMQRHYDASCSASISMMAFTNDDLSQESSKNIKRRLKKQKKKQKKTLKTLKKHGITDQLGDNNNNAQSIDSNSNLITIPQIGGEQNQKVILFQSDNLLMQSNKPLLMSEPLLKTDSQISKNKNSNNSSGKKLPIKKIFKEKEEEKQKCIEILENKDSGQGFTEVATKAQLREQRKKELLLSQQQQQQQQQQQMSQQESPQKQHQQPKYQYKQKYVMQAQQLQKQKPKQQPQLIASSWDSAPGGQCNNNIVIQSSNEIHTNQSSSDCNDSSLSVVQNLNCIQIKNTPIANNTEQQHQQNNTSGSDTHKKKRILQLKTTTLFNKNKMKDVQCQTETCHNTIPNVNESADILQVVVSQQQQNQHMNISQQTTQYKNRKCSDMSTQTEVKCFQEAQQLWQMNPSVQIITNMRKQSYHKKDDTLEQTIEKTVQILHYKKVQYDLELFVKNVNTENGLLKGIRDMAIQRIQYVSKCVLQQLYPNMHYALRVFGSFATGLELPESDIDVGIVYCDPAPFDHQECLMNLLASLTYFKWVVTKQAILGASVPVLKLEINPMIPFCDFTYPNPPLHFLDFDNLSKYDFLNMHLQAQQQILSVQKIIKLDMTVEQQMQNLLLQMPPNQTVQCHVGSCSTDLVRNWLQDHPCMTPVVLLLKSLLQKKQLFNVFKGGISSYCLIVLIYAFIRHWGIIKHKNFQSSAQLLIELLNFYGFNFNPKQTKIQFQNPTYNPFQPINPFNDLGKLTIYAPITNFKTIGENAYLIDEILKEFKLMYAKIQQNQDKFKKAVEVQISLDLKEFSTSTTIGKLKALQTLQFDNLTSDQSKYLFGEQNESNNNILQEYFVCQ